MPRGGGPSVCEVSHDRGSSEIRFSPEHEHRGHPDRQQDMHAREAVQHLTQAVLQTSGGQLRDDAAALWHGGPPRDRDATSGQTVRTDSIKQRRRERAASSSRLSGASSGEPGPPSLQGRDRGRARARRQST
jgi:hypothetical protein